MMNTTKDRCIVVGGKAALAGREEITMHRLTKKMRIILKNMND